MLVSYKHMERENVRGRASSTPRSSFKKSCQVTHEDLHFNKMPKMCQGYVDPKNPSPHYWRKQWQQSCPNRQVRTFLGHAFGGGKSSSGNSRMPSRKEL